MTRRAQGMVRQWQDLFYEERYSCTVRPPAPPSPLSAAAGTNVFSALAALECPGREFRT